MTNAASLPPLSAEPDPAAELRQLRDEAAHRRDLLALTAHELRNPLHAMSLHLSLIRAMANAKGVEDIAARIARTQIALSRYAERVTVLMELLGSPDLLYPLNPTLTDVAQRLELLLESLEQEARSRGISLRFQARTPCVGLCDGIALEQIVDNLLLNAFKHAAATEVTVSVSHVDGQALIEVSDNGVGIAPEDQQPIFDKFSVAQHGPRGGGTGLGLWIVMRLLSALGGNIKLHSRPNEGATFLVSFPLPSSPMPP